MKEDLPVRHLLTPEELAWELKVPLSTIYYWTNRLEIPFIKVGRHLRFNLTEVLSDFQEKTKNTRRGCGKFSVKVHEPVHCSLKTKSTDHADSNERDQKHGDN